MSKEMDVVNSLKEACKRGVHTGLKQYHAETASHISYVEWLENRVEMMTLLVARLAGELSDVRRG